jgi:hypothetical protein
MERRWLALARSIGFSERLDSFLGKSIALVFAHDWLAVDLTDPLTEIRQQLLNAVNNIDERMA